MALAGNNFSRSQVLGAVFTPVHLWCRRPPPCRGLSRLERLRRGWKLLIAFGAATYILWQSARAHDISALMTLPASGSGAAKLTRDH